jgi:hypothetical protein
MNTFTEQTKRDLASIAEIINQRIYELDADSLHLERDYLVALRGQITLAQTVAIPAQIP